MNKSDKEHIFSPDSRILSEMEMLRTYGGEHQEGNANDRNCVFVSNKAPQCDCVLNNYNQDSLMRKAAKADSIRAQELIRKPMVNSKVCHINNVTGCQFKAQDKK